MSSSSSLYPCLIVYGTQTGNAREIAKIIYDEFEKFAPSNGEGRNNQSNNSVVLFEMNDYVAKDKELADLPKNYQSILLICSTTGNGDVPDNAVRFFRQLKRFKTEKTRYASLKYSVLGLGDTNYEKFNESGKTLDILMKGMGAIPLLPKALADDGTGLEATVEPWKKNIIDLYKESAKNNEASSSSAPPASNVSDAAPSTIAVASISTPSAAAASVPSSAVSLSDRANGVIDSEKKIIHPIEQPKFIARIPKCHTLLKIEENSSDSLPAYILARYKNIETEAQLRGYTPEAPCLASISNARYLTSNHSHETDGRMVIHMELELPSSNPSQRINYSPGDSIGLYVANEERMVKDLLKRLNYTGNEVITIQAKPKKQKDAKNGEEEKTNNGAEASLPLSHISSPSRLIDILSHSVDITSPPKKSFIRMLAEYCSDTNDKKRLYHLLSREGFKEYDDLLFHQHATLLDLLEQFPSCNPALAHLLDQLPPLQPRYYSITTSPLLYPNSIHIAFTVVNYHTPVPNSNAAITRRGVATHHLWRLCTMAGLLNAQNLPGSPSLSPLSSLSNVPGTILSPTGRFSIPIFLRRTVDFHLPEDISRPVIMIGPGTGVCPFRAFVQHRRCQLSALQSSQGRTCGWWRGLEMEIEEKEEESFLSAPNPRLTTTIKPSTSTSNLVTLTLTRSPTPPTATNDCNPRIIDDRSSIRITQIKANGEQKVCVDESKEKQINLSDDESMVAEEYTANHSPSTPSDSGDMLLFFGCRDRSNDFLYGNEWPSFIYDHTLTAMYAAFSRQSAQKFYVQDLITRHQKSIVDLILDKNASIFICGDGAKMAKDVQSCFESIIDSSGKQQLIDRGFASGAAFVDHLIKKEKRYLQDIWS